MMPPINDDNLIEKPDPALDETIADDRNDRDSDEDFDADLLTQEERDLLGDDDMTMPDMYDPDAEPDADEAPEPVVAPVAAPVVAPVATPVAAPVVAPIANVDAIAPIIPDRIDRTRELADLTAREVKLESDFADGQVTDKDYATQLKAIAKEQGSYEYEAKLIDDQVQSARAAGDAAFNAAAQAVITATPELVSPEHYAAFNRHVEAVTADKRNAGLTFLQQIHKAQLLYSVDANRPDLAPVTAQNPAPVQKAAPLVKDQPIRAQPVPTLARVPASNVNEVDSDRFAALNRILDSGNIEAHERALSRMTAEQRESYGNFEG